jgi:hypothetical protein
LLDYEKIEICGMIPNATGFGFGSLWNAKKSLVTPALSTTIKVGSGHAKAWTPCVFGVHPLGCEELNVVRDNHYGLQAHPEL